MSWGAGALVEISTLMQKTREKGSVRTMRRLLKPASRREQGPGPAGSADSKC